MVNSADAVVALVLATIVITGVVVLVASDGADRRMVRYGRSTASILVRFHHTADVLGIDRQVWAAALIASPVAGFSLGLWLHLSAFLAAVVGLLFMVGLPWMLGYRSASVHHQRDEAAVRFARGLFERSVTRDLPVVLQEYGYRPIPELSHCLPVLADTSILRLDLRLARCAELAQSTVMTRLCAYLVIGLKKNVAIMREAFPTVILPALERTLDLRRGARRQSSEKRGTITILAALLIALFSFIYWMAPSFKAFYDTTTGSVAITVFIGMFGLLVALIRNRMKEVRHPGWDLALLCDELDRYAAGTPVSSSGRAERP